MGTSQERAVMPALHTLYWYDKCLIMSPYKMNTSPTADACHNMFLTVSPYSNQIAMSLACLTC